MSSDSVKSNESAWKVEEYVTIIIVCLIFLALSNCLGTFKRMLCRIFCDRNRVQRRRAVGESIPEDSSMQIQSLGLESSMVQSLPTFEFKKKEGEQDKATNVECAICLGEFEEGEWLKHLPHCSHSFHVSCIDTWFQSHSNCPLCRSFVHQHILQYSVLLQPLSREDIFQERAQSIRPQSLPISIRQQQPSTPP